MTVTLNTAIVTVIMATTRLRTGIGGEIGTRIETVVTTATVATTTMVTTDATVVTTTMVTTGAMVAMATTVRETSVTSTACKPAPAMRNVGRALARSDHTTTSKLLRRPFVM